MVLLLRKFRDKIKSEKSTMKTREIIESIAIRVKCIPRCKPNNLTISMGNFILVCTEEEFCR